MDKDKIAVGMATLLEMNGEIESLKARLTVLEKVEKAANAKEPDKKEKEIKVKK